MHDLSLRTLLSAIPDPAEEIDPVAGADAFDRGLVVAALFENGHEFLQVGDSI